MYATKISIIKLQLTKNSLTDFWLSFKFLTGDFQGEPPWLFA